MPVPPSLEIHLKALSIAAGVFAQITTASTVTPVVGEPYVKQAPRTLKDFRESVDAVFKAAGLEKVKWD